MAGLFDRALPRGSGFTVRLFLHREPRNGIDVSSVIAGTTGDNGGLARVPPRFVFRAREGF